MKKTGIITWLVIIVLVGAVFAVARIDFNRLGKEHAYYHIGEPASVDETKTDSGSIWKSYRYTGTASTEDGKTIDVEFTAVKQLREGAYLKLYLNKEKEVTSYDEVQKSEIPGKAIP